MLAGDASGGSRTSARLNVVIARSQSRRDERRRKTRAVFGSTKLATIASIRRCTAVILLQGLLGQHGEISEALHHERRNGYRVLLQVVCSLVDT